MKRTTLFDIKFSAIFKVLLIIFLIWAFIQLKALVISLFIAFIIATAIRPLVQKFKEYKVPQGVSVAGIYIILILFIGTMIYVVGKALTQQLIEFGRNLPTIISTLQTSIPFFAQFDLSSYTTNLSSNLQSLGSDFGGNLGIAVGALNSAFDVITSILTILVISLYLTLGLDRIVSNLIKFIPHINREKTMQLYVKVENQVGAWLRGQLFLMILIGILTYITLKILGIPFALPLAIFAGFMEILPIIGPLVYSAVIVLVALTVGPVTAILSVIACLIIQQLEGNVIVPVIMKKAVGLSPVTTIIAIIAGGTLMGVIGALLAVPIAAVLSAVLQDLYAKD